MNEKIKNLTKNPKFLIVLGISGILLIFLSTLFSNNDGGEKTVESINAEYTAEQYCEMLENNVKNIVTGITGDKNPTVVITLESGIRYSYAAADEIDTSSSAGTSTDQSSQSKKRSYITVKNSDGSEKALIVTEYMPEIRGVAVICKNAENTATADKIKNAVTAALNVTSKRVYISGGTE